MTLQRTITVHCTWRHPRGFSEPAYVHIPYDTLELLRRYGPDVVISAELGARTFQAALYRRMRPESRLIITAAVSEHTEEGRGMVRRWLRRWILRQADAVLVNGESGRRYIGGFGIPSDRIHSVSYAGRMSAFLAVPLRREPRTARRLLFVGQLVERKGLRPFLYALSQWALRHPDHSPELWVVGDGPSRDQLQALLLPSNISVRWVGSVSYDEIAALYAQAGILVFPTLADEWGLVVNEAMAAGLPVLGSMYSQAVEELVADGVAGWTFRPDHPSEMYEALDRALSTPADALEGMRVAARLHVKDLTPGLVAGRILEAVGLVCS